MRKIQKIFEKPTIKAVIISFVTAWLGVATGILGTWDVQQKFFWAKVIHFGVVFVLYIIILALSTTSEVNQRRLFAEREKLVSNYEEVYASIFELCKSTSKNLNKSIKRAKRDGKFDLGIWNFDSSCENMCADIYYSLTKLSDSKNYEVMYVKRLHDYSGNLSTKVKMVGFVNSTSIQMPSRFMKIQSYDGATQTLPYRDIQLFKINKNKTDLQMGVGEVNKVVVNNNGRFHLHIGIPVFCEEDKMIGLIDIFGTDDSFLGSHNEEELKERINKFIVPFISIAVLLHKIERAIFLGATTKSLDYDY